MTDGWSLLADLVVTLTAALVLGVIFEKLKQNAIIGYLLAGVLVGPSTTAWVSSPNDVQTLSEFGVALLLFTLGLEFSLRRLVRLGKVAILGGLIQILLVIVVFTGGGMALGLELKTAVTLGAIASLASTAVVLRLLADTGDIDTLHGRSSVGILLMQDIAVVPLVMMVTIMGGQAASEAGGKGSLPIGQLLINSGLLIAIMFLVVTVVLPRLLDASAFARNRELPILTAIATCMASAWGAHEAGLSPALGAFLAGMLLAETKFAEQIRSDVFPLRTLFVTLFVASIGMVLNVPFLGQHIGLVAVGLVAVLVLKALFTFAAVKPFLPSHLAAVAVAITLCQVGEFSFVLAKIGRSNGLLSEFLFQLVVSVSVASLILTPTIVTFAPKVARFLSLKLFNIKKMAEEERKDRRGLRNHVLLIGFGEAGQAAAQQLHDSNVKVLVMDIDHRLVTEAEERGMLGVLGDASQNSNLLHAGAPEAKAIIIALPDFRVSMMIISHLQLVAPHVPIIVRARYHRFADELDMSGAEIVVDEETLVGLKLGDRVVELLSKPRTRKVKPESAAHSDR